MKADDFLGQYQLMEQSEIVTLVCKRLRTSFVRTPRKIGQALIGILWRQFDGRG
jgi:hypothetical protein